MSDVHRLSETEERAAGAGSEERAAEERLGTEDVARELERAALAALEEHKPDRVLATHVEFWSAVVLDHAQVPQSLFTPLFVCARTAGWSAHILEQKRNGRLIRPASLYVGPGPRPLSASMG